MGNKEDLQNQFITIAELVYFLYFIVLFGAKAIGLNEGMTAYNISLVIGMLIFGIKVLMTEHSVLEYTVMGSLLLLSLIVYINTGEKGLLLFFTMMLGMKGVSVKRVFKVGAVLQGTAFSALIILSLLGIIEESFYVQNRMGLGMVFRHSLGYPHPNTLHTTYVILMVFVMYLVGKQSKKKLAAISACLFFGSLYIYMYSCSNTGLLISFFYLIINFYFQTRKTINKFEKVLIYLLYPACLLFSIIGPLVIKGKLFDFINKLLNSRWMLSVYYLQNEPITLFGTRFKEPPTTQYMIDSSFLYSFLQLGLVAFVILTLLYMLVIHDSVKKDKRAELAIIISFCVMGISDPFLFNLSYKNLVFIFIGAVLYSCIKKKETALPSIFQQEICFLRFGEKKLLIRPLNRAKIGVGRRDILYSIFVFGAVAVMSVGIYSITTKVPEVVYINEEAWKETAEIQYISETDWPEYASYLTVQDVEKIKEEGGIIKEYQGENEPMYALTENVPRMEHIRNTVSIGIWGGLIAIVFCNLIKSSVIRAKKEKEI